MGTLIGKAYPTVLALGQADHTYVECGTGKRGWKCFGGKTGGRVLRSGSGSTARADAIAGPGENGHLKCYLINGVCHQAANRILLPAGITVEGARGYQLSQALFSTYGRVGLWPCSSPFVTHPGTTGDLPECVDGETEKGIEQIPPVVNEDPADAAHVREVMRIYEAHAGLFELEGAAPIEEIEAFHLELFANLLEFRLGPLLDDDLRARLMDVRRGIERRQLEIDQRHAADSLAGAELANAVDDVAIDLQQQVAAETTDAVYESLFGLRKGDLMTIADRTIDQNA
jgi:hypothetical protein